jgi:hypothetical protein
MKKTRQSKSSSFFYPSATIPQKNHLKDDIKVFHSIQKKILFPQKILNEVPEDVTVPLPNRSVC